MLDMSGYWTINIKLGREGLLWRLDVSVIQGVY